MPIMRTFLDAILAALDSTGNVAPEDLTTKGKALEDLIAVPKDDKNVSLLAICEYIQLWEDPPRDFDIDNGELDDDQLQQIQQKVAEQRILLGLRSASVEVLVGILANNTEACRAYIESRKLIPVSVVANQDILTDGAVERIQSSAINYLWIRTIDKIDDPNVLLKLQQAKSKNEVVAIINTTHKIKFSGVISESSPGVQERLKDRMAELAFKSLDDELNKFSLAHPQLLKALKALPPEKGIQLIQDGHVPLILNAKDEAGIARYLGNNMGEVDAILAENNRLAVFRDIKNDALARVLLSINGLTLKDNGAAGINSLLSKDRDLSSDEAYIDFVNTVKDYCVGFKDDDEMCEAFGLNNDGSAIIEPKVRDTIDEQHQYNVGLLELRSKYKHPYFNEVFDLLLSIEKDIDLAPPSHNVLNHPDYDKAQFQKIISQLRASANLTEFLTRFSKTQESQTIKEQLASRLTPESFINMRNNIKRADLQHNDIRHVRAALVDLQSEIGAVKKSYQPLIDQLKTVDYLLQLEPNQLAGPAFQATSAAKAEALRAKYTGLLRQTESVIEQLKRDYSKLHDHLNTLPSTEELGAREQNIKEALVETPQQIETYRTLITAELEQILSAIHQYDTVKRQTEAIKSVLDEAQKGGVYRQLDAGLTCRAVAANQTGVALPGTLVPNAAAEPGVVLELNGQDAKANRTLLQTTKDADALIYDTIHQSADNSMQIRGRFSQTYPADVMPASQVVKAGERKSPVCRLQVEQAPLFTKGNDNKNEMAKAKVKFYMEMAAATLAANHGKAPTKENPIRLYGSDENEMKYLWTALVLLGEGKPGFGKEAIKVQTSTFVPKDELGKLYGYSNNSLYNTVFKEHRTEVRVVQDRSKQDLNNEAHDKATKVMDKFKSGLDKVKHDPKAVEALKAKEGPAPEPESLGMRNNN